MHAISTTIRIREEKKQTLQEFIASILPEEGLKLNRQYAVGALIYFGTVRYRRIHIQVGSN